MARKYWKMLDTLVQFKPYWVNYENERLKPLIDHLTPYEYSEEDTPLYHDRKRISKETGLSMNRVNRGILHLPSRFKQFTDNPPDIKTNEVSIHIHIPFDEVDKARRKNPKYN